MSNIAGKTFITARTHEQAQSQAVDEWSTRVAETLPYELELPKNTLRGHPQPWRTRPAKALEDPGVLHQSVKGPLEDPFSRATFAATRQGNQWKLPNTNNSTAALDPAEWASRLGGTTVSCGTRGSLAPNWTPREQRDLTATGSVNVAAWPEGTQKFVAPGTTTFASLVSVVNAKKADETWSTADLSRLEWEQRLTDGGVAMA
eukprot:CAMPEP_0119107216 /NCGR_PEP_ID=MMETSP1180-20130426/9552_1 /TAXON_ID=3052 ORGANISM="Chlamydomonas cf sp, Strain CCMP681" /NCGR_SAMPLE_ID=MMETSP1180 /ASSEMBLY_ACC=CAM_ASM_000741 /LENGTH=202 /DNA_ID=CAMNT_0007092673 /DNA_START=44 /DNA_END=652 /DNA_ORIENTATION=+